MREQGGSGGRSLLSSAARAARAGASLKATKAGCRRWKVVICSLWEKDFCVLGDACFDAHGAHDLSTTSSAPSTAASSQKRRLPLWNLPNESEAVQKIARASDTAVARSSPAAAGKQATVARPAGVAESPTEEPFDEAVGTEEHPVSGSRAKAAGPPPGEGAADYAAQVGAEEGQVEAALWADEVATTSPSTTQQEQKDAAQDGNRTPAVSPIAKSPLVAGPRATAPKAAMVPPRDAWSSMADAEEGWEASSREWSGNNEESAWSSADFAGWSEAGAGWSADDDASARAALWAAAGQAAVAKALEEWSGVDASAVDGWSSSDAAEAWQGQPASSAGAVEEAWSSSPAAAWKGPGKAAKRASAEKFSQLDDYKTSLCKAYQIGFCALDQLCPNAHGEEELRLGADEPAVVRPPLVRPVAVAAEAAGVALVRLVGTAEVFDAEVGSAASSSKVAFGKSCGKVGKSCKGILAEKVCKGGKLSEGTATLKGKGKLDGIEGKGTLKGKGKLDWLGVLNAFKGKGKFEGKGNSLDVCWEFMEGNCARGERCKWLHTEEEAPPPSPIRGELASEPAAGSTRLGASAKPKAKVKAVPKGRAEEKPSAKLLAKSKAAVIAGTTVGKLKPKIPAATKRLELMASQLMASGWSDQWS